MKYDTIIIGSGLGGLTCGAFLAHAGMKVLVLEKHQKIGGYAHNFNRRKYVFESGIHSVAMAKEGMIMGLLRKLGVENRVETIEFPQMFSMATPEGSMDMPSKKDEIKEFLTAQFPHERDNLQAFFKEIEYLYQKISDAEFDFESSFVQNNADFIYKYHNRSYKQYIEDTFSDETLRSLFYAQWPFCGGSPCFGSILYYLMMYVVHFFEGSHYCKGGFSTLADALASVITDRGGAVKTRSEVLSISGEEQRVRFVRTTKDEEYEADLVVSNITPYDLHFNLLEENLRGRRWQRRVSNLNISVSSVIAYYGMNPQKIGVVPRDIIFWYDSHDHGTIFSNIMKNKKEKIDHLIFLKTIEDSDFPTLTLMNFVQKSYASDWKSEKEILAERMLDQAESIYPGLKEAIDFTELGSPTTFERYTANTDGAIYGFENTKDMYGEAKLPVVTHLENLYQTGHWNKPGGGVWNVIANAHAASKIILQRL